MIICNSKKFIFLHIHKTAGSSLEIAIEPHLSWNDIVLGGSDFGEVLNSAYYTRHGISKHSTYRDIEAVIGAEYLKDYYIFTLVRNPVKRILSLYNFVGNIVLDYMEAYDINRQDLLKNLATHAHVQPELSWVTARAFLRNASFSGFIRDDILTVDQAYQAQAQFIYNSKKEICVDFIKMEDFTTKKEHIEKKIGINFNMGHENKSRRLLTEVSDVSNDDFLFIKKLYEEDFEIFGY